MAGSDEYDYIISTGNTNVTNSINAYLRDLSNAPYIDYDQPWWWTDSIDALSLDGKTYNQVIAQADISSATLSRVSRCVQYGKGYSKLLK